VAVGTATEEPAVAPPVAAPLAAPAAPTIGVGGERLTRNEAFDLVRRAVESLVASDEDSVGAPQVRQRAFELLGRDSESLSERMFERILRDAHDADLIDLRRRGDSYELGRAAQAESVADQLNRAAAAQAATTTPTTTAPAAPRGMGPRGLARGRTAGRGAAPPPELLSIGVVSVPSIGGSPAAQAAPAPEPVTQPAATPAASAAGDAAAEQPLVPLEDGGASAAPAAGETGARRGSRGRRGGRKGAAAPAGGSATREPVAATPEPAPVVAAAAPPVAAAAPAAPAPAAKSGASRRGGRGRSAAKIAAKAAPPAAPVTPPAPARAPAKQAAAAPRTPAKVPAKAPAPAKTAAKAPGRPRTPRKTT
jgi:hypothetical protein